MKSGAPFGGVGGGGVVAGLDFVRTRRMTGSALEFTEDAVRFILLLGEKKKVRVWERKGLGVAPDRRLADDGKRF